MMSRSRARSGIFMPAPPSFGFFAFLCRSQRASSYCTVTLKQHLARHPGHRLDCFCSTSGSVPMCACAAPRHANRHTQSTDDLFCWLCGPSRSPSVS